ncbi:SHOCT domain-containing protein [Halanaerobacter jeridensis]|uniref:Membrane protein n=1 Tax=Halanaerobacter jeridensis TaxID=706427 RepID=A0A938XNP9_9FIRM|nr:SHOCT domain-containing protein [Halanaerobacter jeridensis]MBM7555762.1 putative membrane protein [Halanaerobacter jeridensis]
MFPLLMPIIAGGVVYFLYKQGVFEGMCHSHHIEKKDKITSDDETPLEILKKRYAQGDISTEEYQERKEKLQEE